MRSVGVERVSSALFHYEAGRIPPVDALRGLSFVLRLPFEDLIDRICEELSLAPVKWGEPVLHQESELPDDAIEIARAYATMTDQHVRAATRALLLRDSSHEAVDESAEKKTGTTVPRGHRSHRARR
jgi:hypothetical protein